MFLLGSLRSRGTAFGCKPSLLREKLGTVTSLWTVCHLAGSEVYRECVSALPVHSDVGLFSFTQRVASGFLLEGIVHVSQLLHVLL